MKKIKVTKKEIAEILGIDIQAFYRMEKRYPTLVKYATKQVMVEKALNV